MAWTLPCAGTVSSPYGPRILAAGMFPFHYGVDVRAGRGPIFAAQDGTVRVIWQTSKGGWVVDIRHADEGGRQVRTRYIHMNRLEIRVAVGQKVKAGDWIGNSGESGSPGSPHLHFEVMSNGTLIDPVPFLRDRGLTFGVSLVSRVIGGVGVPPAVPTTTLPDPLEETDMTPEQDNLLRHLVAMVGEVPGRAATAVWAHPLRKGDAPAVSADAWLVDTRIIVGQIDSPTVDVDEAALAAALAPLLPKAVASMTDADLARFAQAAADESDRRARARLA